MGKKILLADDSITIQKVIELTFSDEDFEVVTVGNGRLAIERVQELRPDVVLCDIIMPEKDGYEVCDFVKKTAGLSHIPVLLLTGAFEPFDKDKAARVGADGYLAKPFEPQALIAKVKDLLAKVSNKSLPPTPRAAVAPVAPAPAPAAWAPAAPAPAPAATPPAPSVTVPAPPAATAPAPPAAPAPAPPPPAPALAAVPVVAEAAFIPEEPEVEVSPVPVEADDGVGFVDDSFEPIPSDAVTIPRSGRVAPSTPSWATPTVEVSLEVRAQASKESALAGQAPLFEEVFDEVIPEVEPESEPTPPAPVAVAPPAPTPVVVWPPPVAAPEFEESSFADVADESEPKAAGPAASEAAEVAVPVEGVEKIAQRVVAQVSEKVVREIAWEVIPELAEKLIRQEIERLKAELKNS